MGISDGAPPSGCPPPSPGTDGGGVRRARRVMGISDGLGGGGGAALDGSVGSIVWVRRRNGSWWPGRILGPEELPASHLMSPRSGAPVKLLGREDASVDWYNLEKSKRVKAFRCGEFDACIERAEASQAIPIKKREKYARREDAILHALELEKKYFGMKQQQGNSDASKVEETRSSNFLAEVYMKNNELGVPSKASCHKSQSVSGKAVTSHEEEDDMNNSLCPYKGINETQLGWKEDVPEAMSWVTELQDFGLQIAPLNREFSESVWKTYGEPVENHLEALSTAEPAVEGESNSCRSNSFFSLKRKISQDGTVEESLGNRHAMHQPLVQVIQNSEEFPISRSFQFDYDAGVISAQPREAHKGVVYRAKRSRCIYLPAVSNDSMEHSGHLSEETAVTTTQFGVDGHRLCYPASWAEEGTSSGMIEATESDSSERGFGDAHREEINLLGDKSLPLLHGSKDGLPSEYQITAEFGRELNDGMHVSSHMSQLHQHEQIGEASVGIGVSRWNLKGKRKNRNSAKRHTAVTNQKRFFNGTEKCSLSVSGTAYGSKSSTSGKRKIESADKRTSDKGLYRKKEFSYAHDGNNFVDKEFGRYQLTGYGNGRSLFPLQEGMSNFSFNDSDIDSQLMSHSGWEVDGPSRIPPRAYWEESYVHHEPVYARHFNDRTESVLVDVDLKVQARYQGEHVPLVSLMSRLNGKAIIGHPLQIEILEDGSSGQLVSRNNAVLGESTPPPAVWRTARRTVMQRVPRLNHASAFEGEDAEPLTYSDHENRLPHTRFVSGQSDNLFRSVRRSISYHHRSQSGKSHKKLPKRTSLSNQKTRMLSSIATQQKSKGGKIDANFSRAGDILGGLVNPEGGMPLVTCVPMKVVFSRILEAVGRPSAAAAFRVRMATLKKGMPA